ncbi:MAG: M23 family metallopeptidase [Gammaproteobacteria bacterium]|nr:M23 family metallopeptidase [Gammaproteobacteria bacterium]
MISDARPDAQALAWQAGLERQTHELEALRALTQENLDALALRVGQMNAHVIRLDALGQRLTAMAELDDGEFDFSRTPGLGGPEDLLMSANGQSNELGDVLRMMEELDVQLADRRTQLAILEDLMLNRNLRARVQPEGRPVASGWLSSRFGRRTDPFTGKPAVHRGVDFAGRPGTKILSAGDGVVIFAGSRYGYGRMVEINHGNGYVTRYAHNTDNLVQVGDTVRKGQAIATMGSTGRATAPHLHFEVLRDGRQVDPLPYIQARR